MKKKILSGALALIFSVGAVFPAFNQAYASSKNAPYIYNAAKNIEYKNYSILEVDRFEVTDYFTDEQLYYRGPYREDVLHVNKSEKFINESLEATRQFRSWAFDNVKVYAKNIQTGKIEYLPLGDVITADSKGKARADVKKEYVNKVEWLSFLQLQTAQDAYRNYLDGTYKNMNPKQALDHFVNDKDEFGYSILDRFNSYQKNYVKNKLESNDSNTHYIEGDKYIRLYEYWPINYNYNHGEGRVVRNSVHKFILLMTEDYPRVHFSEISDGKDTYISFLSNSEGDGEEDTIKTGNYKFVMGVKEINSKDYSKGGDLPTIYDVLTPGPFDEYDINGVKSVKEVTDSKTPYYEDVVYLDQNVDLLKDLYNEVSAARKKAFDDNIVIGGRQVQDILMENYRMFATDKDMLKQIYADVFVFDNMKYLQNSYENLINARNGNFEYIWEDKFPNGEVRAENKLEDEEKEHVLYHYSKTTEMKPSELVRSILYTPDSGGRTAYDRLAEGDTDVFVMEAERILNPDYPRFDVASLKTNNEYYLQIKPMNYWWTSITEVKICQDLKVSSRCILVIQT